MKYTRIYRLFRLITLVQGSAGLNAKRLAEECEATERTIYRDLEVLAETGIPISFDAETGGYSIRRDFFMRPIDLTLEEAMAMLLLAREAGKRGQLPHVSAAGKAAEKLMAILPGAIGEIIQEVMPKVTVDLARASNEPTEDVYSAMRDAIRNRRAMQCRYESPNRRSKKDVGDFRFDPYGLYFGQRAWYVVGLHHGHDEIRTLKLSRFVRHKNIGRPYAIPDGFSLESHFGKAWRMVPSHDGTIHHIELRFDATVAETVADTHWHDSQEIAFGADDSVAVTFDVDGLEEVVWWILSYGPHCRVIGPPELRRRVAEMARGMAAGYGEDCTK